MKTPLLHTLLAAAVLALPSELMAQEAAQADALPEEGALTLTLNAAMPGDDSCVLTFVIRNSLGADISSAVYETVLFRTTGAVERLMLFDMQSLPAGRPRVRQFQVPGLACADLGNLLLNGATACEAGDLGSDVCVSALKVASDIDIGIEG